MAIVYPFYALVTFDQTLNHVIQTYSWMATPVRWNSNKEQSRQMIFRLGNEESRDYFYKNMLTLAKDQRRAIRVQPVKDIFCNSCGVQYHYAQSTGTKTCADCGCTEFIS